MNTATTNPMDIPGYREASKKISEALNGNGRCSSRCSDCHCPQLKADQSPLNTNFANDVIGRHDRIAHLKILQLQ